MSKIKWYIMAKIEPFKVLPNKIVIRPRMAIDNSPYSSIYS